MAEGALEEALGLLLERESYAFTTRWETLTKNQQRFLRGLAMMPGGGTVLGRVRAGERAPDAGEARSGRPSVLLKLDLIDREEGTFVITDRFFRLWILRKIK